MEKQTFGGTIAKLRREKGMTQAELAEKMCVTDKAVSKWERDLSFPDVGTIPKLAQLSSVEFYQCGVWSVEGGVERASLSSVEFGGWSVELS